LPIAFPRVYTRGRGEEDEEERRSKRERRETQRTTHEYERCVNTLLEAAHTHPKASSFHTEKLFGSTTVGWRI
jgi:hypothetical protein